MTRSRIAMRLALAAVASVLMMSCNRDKDDETKRLDISGTWELTSIADTRAIAVGNEQVEVYIVFKNDEPTTTRAKKSAVPVSATGTFSLYQKLGAGRSRKFNGKWTLTDVTLTGVYDGGRLWGADYQVTLDEDNKRLILAAPTETCVYVSSTLPAEL